MKMLLKICVATLMLGWSSAFAQDIPLCSPVERSQSPTRHWLYFWITNGCERVVTCEAVATIITDGDNKTANPRWSNRSMPPSTSRVLLFRYHNQRPFRHVSDDVHCRF